MTSSWTRASPSQSSIKFAFTRDALGTITIEFSSTKSESPNGRRYWLRFKLCNDKSSQAGKWNNLSWRSRSRRASGPRIGISSPVSFSENAGKMAFSRWRFVSVPTLRAFLAQQITRINCSVF